MWGVRGKKCECGSVGGGRGIRAAVWAQSMVVAQHIP